MPIYKPDISYLGKNLLDGLRNNLNYIAKILNGIDNDNISNTASINHSKIDFFGFDRSPKILIQDYKEIKDVGDLDQQMAGHIFDLAEPGTESTDVIALYKFLSTDLTKDESSGGFTLSATGTPTATDGITGDDYAASCDNSNYLSNGTLLDVMPTALAIDGWFKFSDGQAVDKNYFCHKNNGGGTEAFDINLTIDGIIQVNTNVGGVVKTINSTTTLPNGQTEFVYICFNWDTTNGIRLWINSELEASDTSATTLMANGTASEFFLWDFIGISVTTTYGMLRIRDKVLTKKDVDLGYSTRYAIPNQLKSYEGYNITPWTKENGDDDFISELSWGGMEVTRSNNYIYRYGDIFNSDNKLKLVARI